VFFNDFAAAEPSANVCVAHGTPCSDPSVYPTFCNKPVKQWYCLDRFVHRFVVTNFVPGMGGGTFFKLGGTSARQKTIENILWFE